MIKGLQSLPERRILTGGEEKVRVHVHAPVRDLRQTIRRRSDDPEIAPGSAQRPEQVFVLGRRRLDKVPGSGHHPHGLQRVHQQAPVALQAADAPRERRPDYAYARTRPQRKFLLRFVEGFDELMDFRRAADGDACTVFGQGNGFEGAEIDGQAVEGMVVGHTVASSRREERDLVSGGDLDGILHVLLRCRLDGAEAVGRGVVIGPSLLELGGILGCCGRNDLSV